MLIKSLSSLIDDPVTLERRLVEAFITFEMILRIEKGTEQFSCFRPIRLILQPRLTGRNEKGFKDFLTKNAAWRSYPPHVVASTHKYCIQTRIHNQNLTLHTHTHTHPPVSGVHSGRLVFSSFKLWAAQQGLCVGGAGWGWFMPESPLPNTWGLEPQFRLDTHTDTHASSPCFYSIK